MTRRANKELAFAEGELVSIQRFSDELIRYLQILLEQKSPLLDPLHEVDRRMPREQKG